MQSENNNSARKNVPVISGLILSILVGMCLLYVVVTRGEVEPPKKSTQQMPTKIAENPATKAPTAKHLTDQKDPSCSTPFSEEVTVVLVIAIGVMLRIYAWHHGYSNVIKQWEEANAPVLGESE